MQNLNFLETELLDILFRGKNKKYGAYALRKNYPMRMRNALGITAGLFLSIFAIQFGLNGHAIGPIDFPTVKPDIYIHDIQELILPEQVGGKPGAIPPKTETPPKPEIIVPATDVTVPITNIPKPAVPDPVITTGTTGPPVAMPGSGNLGPDGPHTIGPSPGGPAVTTAVIVTAPAPPKIVEIAEFMPEFPGGEDAMIAYLKSHMNYPKLAESIGIEGTVFVQFVVNTRGKISRIEVLRGIGGGCDKEAGRVIKSMPAWKPGTQDGHKVNVSFVLPVKFEL